MNVIVLFMIIDTLGDFFSIQIKDVICEKNLD